MNTAPTLEYTRTNGFWQVSQIYPGSFSDMERTLVYLIAQDIQSYSYDGIIWQPANASNGVFTTGVNYNKNSTQVIKYANGTFVVVGVGTNTHAWSTDGINWTAVGTSTNIFSIEGNSVCWDGKRWISVGQGTANTVATSCDGITWYGVATSTSLFTSNGIGVSTNYNASSSQLVIRNTSGTTLSNRLEIVADSYYNQGPTKLSVSITSNNL